MDRAKELAAEFFYAIVGAIAGISLTAWVMGILHFILQVIVSVVCAVAAFVAVELVRRKWFNKNNHEDN